MFINPADLALALSQQLPGWVAHQLMDVRPQGYRTAPPSAQLSAVGVILFPLEQGTHLIYVKRHGASGPLQHRGQIGFPGGKKEVSDVTLWDTAKREIREETGIVVEDHHRLGELTPLYIPVSNFLVQPYVIHLQNEPQLTLQEEEIQRSIITSCAYMSETSRIKHQDIPVSEGFILSKVPYYDLYSEVLWGATAMITAELLYLINNLEQR